MNDDSQHNRIVILGSTGSIGTSCLEVVGGLGNGMEVLGLTAHTSWRQLAEQTRKFRPRWSVLSDDRIRNRVETAEFGSDTELCFGTDAIEDVAAADEVDVVICGIVGVAGLRGVSAAISAGKRVGIANKEPLVMAGGLMMKEAAEHGATIIPVDSEHSAIFQAMKSGQPSEVKRVVLTASGGPFRGWTREQLTDVTPEMALAHPTWDMGAKITIDSATLMNKALEIIEAKWLFGLSVDQIEVVIHPQSIIHSFVEFVDGSVIAQLSPPDMKLPIQYALTYPRRVSGVARKLDWSTGMTLQFDPPDLENFPSLQLGFEVAERGGTCGAVLNAANEGAVARFLAGDLRFSEIPRACRAILDAHNFDPDPTMTELLRQDGWAREEIQQWRS